MIAYYIRRSLAGFRQPGRGIEETDNALRTYGLNDGKGPAAGQVFRNPDLARTFRLIAEGGRDAFYTGEIARTIDAYFKRIGGWLRYEDLAAHKSEWIEPHKTGYRGRSEEHTSELQSLMRISYAVFCLKKNKIKMTCNMLLTNYTHYNS